MAHTENGNGHVLQVLILGRKKIGFNRREWNFCFNFNILITLYLYNELGNILHNLKCIFIESIKYIIIYKYNDIFINKDRDG